jgi:hypothetical protein
MLPEVEETSADAGDQGVGGKLLGRTMWFVSSVLWASDGVGGEQGGSVKGKEREKARARAREGSADKARGTGNREGSGGIVSSESLVERDKRRESLGGCCRWLGRL